MLDGLPALSRRQTQDSLLGTRKAEQWRGVAGAGMQPSYGDAGKGRWILLDAPHGYWMETIFATEGRPWPRALVFYVVYASGAVSFAMLHGLDEDGDPTFACDADIFSLSIIALLYLIVFRTNSAYGRWTEGREAWSTIVTLLRDFARSAAAGLDESWRVDNLARHAIAYAITCKQQLRGDDSVDELKAILSEGECELIVSAQHRTLAVLSALSAQLVEARRARRLDPRHAADLEGMLSSLGEVLCVCERILNTRMPFGYIVHIRAFLVLFLMLMPFTLVADARWCTLPIVSILAYALLGVERMALDVEQPFGFDYSDLPLDELVHETAAMDVLETLVRTSHGGVSAFGRSEPDRRARQPAGALARFLPRWLNPLDVAGEPVDSSAVRCVPSARGDGLRPLPMPPRRPSLQIPNSFRTQERNASPADGRRNRRRGQPLGGGSAASPFDWHARPPEASERPAPPML